MLKWAAAVAGSSQPAIVLTRSGLGDYFSPLSSLTFDFLPTDSDIGFLPFAAGIPARTDSDCPTLPLSHGGQEKQGRASARP
jgi:hypothetical protein